MVRVWQEHSVSTNRCLTNVSCPFGWTPVIEHHLGSILSDIINLLLNKLVCHIDATVDVIAATASSYADLLCRSTP